MRIPADSSATGMMKPEPISIGPNFSVHHVSQGITKPTETYVFLPGLSVKTKIVSLILKLEGMIGLTVMNRINTQKTNERRSKKNQGVREF